MVATCTVPTTSTLNHQKKNADRVVARRNARVAASPSTIRTTIWVSGHRHVVNAHHFPEYGVPRVSPSAAAPPAAAATRGGAMEVSTTPAFAREDAMGGAHDAIVASGDAPHFAAEPTSHSAFGDLSAYRVIRGFEVQLRFMPRIPGFVFRQIVTAISPLAQQYGYGRNRKITSARAH